MVSPVSTQTNVADLCAKSLSPARARFLLGLLSVRAMRMKVSGFRPEAHLFDNARAVSAVCKDLRRFAKKSGDAARILSIVLCALQATGAMVDGGDEAQDDEGDDGWLSAGLAYAAQVIGFIAAIFEAYPGTCAFAAQLCVLIIVMMMFSLRRWPPAHAAHPAVSITVEHAGK